MIKIVADNWKMVVAGMFFLLVCLPTISYCLARWRNGKVLARENTRMSDRMINYSQHPGEYCQKEIEEAKEAE